MSEEKSFDEEYQKLFQVISHFVMSELETTIPFDDLAEEQREAILKASMKATEVSSSIMSYFFDIDTFKFDKLTKAQEMIEKKQFKEVSQFIVNG